MTTVPRHPSGGAMTYVSKAELEREGRTLRQGERLIVRIAGLVVRDEPERPGGPHADVVALFDSNVRPWPKADVWIAAGRLSVGSVLAWPEWAMQYRQRP